MTNQIKPGTLCYVTAPADEAGLVVTALRKATTYDVREAFRCLSGGRAFDVLESGDLWEIDRPISWRNTLFGVAQIAMCSSLYLIPIAGPGLDIDISEPETLGELVA